MTVYWEGNAYDTQREAAAWWHGVTQEAMHYRLKQGYTCDDDLWTTGEFWWNGKPYKSLSAAARAANVNRGTLHYWYHVKGYRCQCDYDAGEVVECQHKHELSK